MDSASHETSASLISNDYHRLPVTEKQIRYARQIAQGTGATLPGEVQSDRRALSNWIDEHRAILAKSKFSNYPSSKQVAFAERIARIKRREVPPECFRDRVMMSRWIDSNM
ncbi:hypothetical protein [Oceaniovalibus sp. ACAM 378]|jgi:hypothetical protein|uniref:hypothetical protein n=1 Tax=Oceaniovalibus sp. ACAM 378 TaxID=2599923 RepID=UPI0011D39347|nr:hypothetical protein [Oceaniovalibus sp. ACAM 378]TYB90074.1 hypothetical protein FQ320_04275 [Oceaniovalibus sp. ACAM 378]